jgi:hypothetical protein
LIARFISIELAPACDGERLYAGGSGGDVGGFLVWDMAGEGRVRQLDGPQNTIMHLLPCGDAIAGNARNAIWPHPSE